jgi:hypothetical protein
MEEHRVGVPTLIAHMAKAIKRDERYIPQKTLQRFLAGEMRTNDATVAIFHEFVRALPPAKDDLVELSLTLGNFFRPAPAPGGPLQSASLPDGIFQTYLGDPPANERQIPLRVAAGFLILASKTSLARLVERRFSAPLPSSARPGLPRDWDKRGEHFEGVLVPFDGFHVGLLRSTVTRKPRVHFIARAGAVLWSECQFAPVTDGEEVLLFSERLHLDHLGPDP